MLVGIDDTDTHTLLYTWRAVPQLLGGNVTTNDGGVSFASAVNDGIISTAYSGGVCRAAGAMPHHTPYRAADPSNVLLGACAAGFCVVSARGSTL